MEKLDHMACSESYNHIKAINEQTLQLAHLAEPGTCIVQDKRKRIEVTAKTGHKAGWS